MTREEREQHEREYKVKLDVLFAPLRGELNRLRYEMDRLARESTEDALQEPS